MGSWVKLEIGSIHNRIIDNNYNNRIDTNFRIMREATFEEWYNQKDIRNTLSDYQIKSAKDGYFYLISLD